MVETLFNTILIEAILKALPIGLFLTIVPGAAFFSIIQTSLSKGFKTALFLAMGIATSDICLIALCYLGVAKLLAIPSFNVIMGIIGGIILISYGVYVFLTKEVKSVSNVENITPQHIHTKNSQILYYFKGFLFNITNPFVWILWLGVTSSSGNRPEIQIIFLLVILGTMFSADCLKAYFASKIKQIMSANFIRIINKIAGIALVICGIVLIIRTIAELYF